MGYKVTFFSNGIQLTGRIRRKDKLLDWTLVDGDNGKRYLLADNEFTEVEDEEVCTEKQNVQEAPQRRKRGRPRKLG